MTNNPPKIVVIGTLSSISPTAATSPTCRKALLLDPMVTDIDSERAILDDLLTEFAEYLPQFG